MVAHLGDQSNGMLTLALKTNLMARRRHFCVLLRVTELVCVQTNSSTFRSIHP